MTRLNRHFKRWQPLAAPSLFLMKEIGVRLLERLELIKLTPQVVLDVSHIFNDQAQQLLQKYPAAAILTTNKIAASLSRPRPFWQRWQKHPQSFSSIEDTLPLADASVDFIYSNLLLSDSDLPQLMHEWHRILKPGGLLLFSRLGPDTLKEWRSAEPGVTSKSPFVDMHDIGDLLLHQGFSDPVMDMEVLTVYYRHFNHLLQDLRINNTSVKASVAYRGKAYWQQLKANYPRSLPDEQWPVTCEIVYGHAWKLIKAPKNEAGEFSIPLSKIKR